MKNLVYSLGFLFLTAISAGGCSSGSKGASDTDSSVPQSDDDTYQTDDTDDFGSDSDTASSDTHDDTGDDTEPSTIESVRAPTRTEVKVVFAGGGDDEAKGNAESYGIRCEGEALAVEEVVYDRDAGEVSLTTEKQKLGLTCELTVDIDRGGLEPLTASFECADTARFWVNDFSDPTGYSQYEINAKRVFVGKRCAIYLEDGAANLFSEEMVDYFDEDVYPIETEVFAAPQDLDGNGRVVILGLDGGNYYGGYFSPVNALSDPRTMSMWGLHSNEMELLHINTSAMTGDGRIFKSVIPHELQHLLYNAYHGMTQVYWAYHDEGLAEVATHLVNGANDYAVEYYFGDYQGIIRDGLSLVNWTYAQYENYSLAYLFWMYVASRLGGLESITEVFELPSGSPVEVDELLAGQLETGFSDLHFESLVALWAQAPSGKWGYEGVIEFTGRKPPHVSAGASSVNLEPFAGAFFSLVEAEVDYPGTQGANVVYAGIDEAGNVDPKAPFSIFGGALLTYNANFEFVDFRAEPSGPDIAQVPAALPQFLGAHDGRQRISPAWDNPPPVCPQNADLMRQWRQVRMMREMLR